MASVTLQGRVGVAPCVVNIKLENINWIPLDANTTIEQDALPSEIFVIVVATDKGSFIHHLPLPDKPSWWERLLGR